MRIRPIGFLLRLNRPSGRHRSPYCWGMALPKRGPGREESLLLDNKAERKQGEKKGAKACCSARPLHLLFQAVMPRCTQMIMCQCTLISDVHGHIIIPHVHSHSLLSSQPWGWLHNQHHCGGTNRAPWLKGTLLCPSHKAAGAGSSLQHPVVQEEHNHTAKAIPPNADKGMCSEGWDTFPPRIEN